MLTFPTLLAIALSAAFAASDLYARRVPNKWLICALGLGSLWMIAAWLWRGFGFPSEHLLGFVIGLAVMLPFYALRSMGAGDVKFFAALGFLLGWRALLPIWVIGSLLAGTHALTTLLASRWQPLVALQNHASGWVWWEKIKSARQGRRGTPYATCLAIGSTATVFLWSGNPHG